MECKHIIFFGAWLYIWALIWEADPWNQSKEASLTINIDIHHLKDTEKCIYVTFQKYGLIS